MGHFLVLHPFGDRLDLQAAAEIDQRLHEGAVVGGVGDVLHEGAVDLDDVEGEMWVKTPIVMKGYFRDPQQTKDAFHDGWFKTGDLVKRDEDGYYWITGRVDDVINVSGHRLGTAEVESALVGHRDVAEAAVDAGAEGVLRVRFHTATGEYRWLGVIVHGIRDAAGVLIGRVGSMRDAHADVVIETTDSKEMQRLLVKAGPDGMPAGEYYALVLFGIAGMIMMAMANDLLVVFVALEILSLAVYVLTGIRRDDPRATEAAFKYFLLGAMASAVFLYGIAFTYGVTGSTHLDRIGVVLATQGSTPQPLALAG